MFDNNIYFFTLHFYFFTRATRRGASARGDISVWELSEWFDVTEDFMRKALTFYFKKN